MRKAVLYIALSLDGFIADSAGGVGWLHGHDPALEEGSYGEFAATVDTVIMGRRTYDQVRGELSPGAWPYEGMDCYVLTHRPAARRHRHYPQRLHRLPCDVLRGL